MKYYGHYENRITREIIADGFADAERQALKLQNEETGKYKFVCMRNKYTNELTEMEKYVLQVLDNDPSKFITLNQCQFNDCDSTELVSAVYQLIEKNILKIRHCQGKAYERV